jgi:hypothetical protein
MSDIQSAAGRPKRPASFTVFGIITIILCGFGLLGACSNVVWPIILNSAQTQLERAGQASPDARLIMDEFKALFGFIIPFVIIIGIAGLMGNGVGLTGGIGLLAGKKWARMLCSVYALISLFIIAGSLIFGVVLLGKLEPLFVKAIARAGEIEQFNPDFNVENFRQLAFPVYKALVILIGLLSAVYPILLLVFMNTKKAKAFTQEL